MSVRSDKRFIEKLLKPINITPNGDHPWDLRIHQDQFYSRALHEGILGVGEAYMDGWWDCERLDVFFERIARSDIENQVSHNIGVLLRVILSRLLNLQTKTRSFEVGERHYNLGNELFHAMLDSRMIYSCGYWRTATSLEEAQKAKLELICQKLQLKPGLRVLDIGCGWGGFAKYAAENYGVSVVGLTISQNQALYAEDYCKGLPVQIYYQDYRELKSSFDRIVSIGMFEHVGYHNYRRYMEIAHQNLSEEGIFLLHTIGNNKTYYTANAWITKYIFPNGVIPSITQIGQAMEGLFIMEDWHNFGADYDKTLMAWYHNFTEHWDRIKSHYDERFFRMWIFYLLSSAGAFRARNLQLWQIVLSKQGLLGGYQAPR